MQGRCGDKQRAVKLYDNRRPEALHAYFHEKECLQKLADCTAVVQFEMAGCLQDTLYPCNVTQLFGRPANCKQLGEHQRIATQRALKCLHSCGACHGDIRIANLLFDSNGSCRLADMASCVVKASKEMQSRDIEQLRSL